MMRLTENKSKIWFKVLNQDASPIDGSRETWTIPITHLKGTYTSFPGDPCHKLCVEKSWHMEPSVREATWLISDPNTVYQANSGQRIFVAQVFETPLLEEPGMIWVNSVSLLREATNLDLKPYGIYRAFSQIVS